MAKPLNVEKDIFGSILSGCFQVLKDRQVPFSTVCGLFGCPDGEQMRKDGISGREVKIVKWAVDAWRG